MNERGEKAAWITGVLGIIAAVGAAFVVTHDQMEIGHQKRKVANLEETKGKLEKDLLKSETRAKDTETERDALKTERDDLKTERNDLTRKIAEMQTDNKHTEENLRYETKSKEESEIQLVAARQEIKVLREQLPNGAMIEPNSTEPRLGKCKDCGRATLTFNFNVSGTGKALPALLISHRDKKADLPRYHYMHPKCPSEVCADSDIQIMGYYVVGKKPIALDKPDVVQHLTIHDCRLDQESCKKELEIELRLLPTSGPPVIKNLDELPVLAGSQRKMTLPLPPFWGR